MMITIDKNRCPQNHICPLVATCPVGAIAQEGVGLPTIDTNKCIACGKCVKMCGMKAMSFTEN